MRLVGYKTLQGIIQVHTGLHIGGSQAGLEIGGRDNPVIRNPVDRKPYIPGSSLKGKMRSLFELQQGKHFEKPTDKRKHWGDTHVCDDPDCPVCIIFGSSADKSANGPTRLIVRDAFLVQQRNGESPRLGFDDVTESKTENSLNRITARANPRNFERVVTGADFSFTMVYKVFERNEDDKKSEVPEDETLFRHVLECLLMVEKDALGGAGSRGCGQVEFFFTIPGKDDLVPLANVTLNDFQTVKFETPAT